MNVVQETVFTLAYWADDIRPELRINYDEECLFYVNIGGNIAFEMPCQNKDDMVVALKELSDLFSEAKTYVEENMK